MQFYDFEELCRNICEKHLHTLYEVYNSETNVANQIANRRKIEIEFKYSNKINAHAVVENNKDIVILEMAFLKQIFEIRIQY